MEKLVRICNDLGVIETIYDSYVEMNTSLIGTLPESLNKTFYYSFRHKRGLINSRKLYIDIRGELELFTAEENLPYSQMGGTFIILKLDDGKKMHIYFEATLSDGASSVDIMTKDSNNSIVRARTMKYREINGLWVQGNRFNVGIILFDKSNNLLKLEDFYEMQDLTTDSNINPNFLTKTDGIFPFSSVELYKDNISPFSRLNSTFFTTNGLFIDGRIWDYTFLKNGHYASVIVIKNNQDNELYISDVIFNIKGIIDPIRFNFESFKLKANEINFHEGVNNIEEKPENMDLMLSLTRSYVVVELSMSRLSFQGVNIAYSESYEIWDDSGDPVITTPGQQETGVDNEGGTGDRSSDEISKPVNPITGNTFTNTTYLLNYELLREFKSFLYDSNFLASLDIFQSSKPMTAVICAMMFPFDLKSDGGMLVRGDMRIGTYSFIPPSAHSVFQVNEAYKKILHVGSYKLERFYGSFLDFTPYTKISIFLPYAGRFELDPALVQNKILEVYYEVDVVSGEGRAIVESEGIEIGNYPCMLGVPMFFSVSDKDMNLQAVSQGMITAAIGGVMQNPSVVIGGMGSAVNSTVDAMITPQSTLNGQGACSTIDRVLSQDVYLTITRPETAVPKNYNKIYGRPSLITSSLRALKGFTSCDNVKLAIKGTKQELEQIENLLKEGVVIK